MTSLRWPAWRWAVVLAVPAVLAACSAGSVPGGSGAPASSPAAAGVSCTSAGGKWTAVKPVSPGTGNNDLTGVAVLAAGNAWAVGTYTDTDTSSDGRTLIEHWNGTAWSVVPSPDPGVRPDYYSGDFLTAVSARSPSAIWAVGDYESRGRTQTLIVHWNGTTWNQVASPSPGSADNELDGVWAVSPTDVWAVGEDDNAPPAGSSLILHWNGRRWTQLPSPDPGYRNQLEAVTATSATSAWAVGLSTSEQGVNRPFILHWNGTAWTQAAAPNLPGTRGELLGVDATSATNAWAAGNLTDSTGQRTLILHWNGTAWTRTPSPNPGGPRISSSLHGVAATSASNAWAAGYTSNGPDYQSLILHWNGTAWTQAASPNPGGRGNLAAIAASSPANAWAIGQFTALGADNAVAARYCAAPAGKAADAAG